MADADIAVFQDSFGLFDIRIGEDGDIEGTQGFDTAIAISLFSRQRATEAEVPDATRREGWWGNFVSLIAGFENGSKLWLLMQERLTPEVANKVRDFVNKSLLWLVVNEWAVDVEVDTEIAGDILFVNTVIKRPNGQVEKVGFELWNNTGQ